MVEVERWRRDLVAHRQNRKNGLHGTGGPEQMTDRRFGGRHGDAAGVVADKPLHRVELDLVAEWRRSTMRVDVIDFGWRDAGAPEGRSHATQGAVAVLGGRIVIVGVSRPDVTREPL